VRVFQYFSADFSHPDNQLMCLSYPVGMSCACIWTWPNPSGCRENDTLSPRFKTM